MPYDSFASFRNKKTWRNTDPLHKLLTDWYGKEAGANEIIQHLPEAEQLKEGVDKALKKLVNPGLALLRKVKDEWNDIVGAQLGKVTFPISFSNGVLYIEVSHPAWMMQLGKKEKDMFLEKVQTFSKSKICRNIKFVPPGRNK